MNSSAQTRACQPPPEGGGLRRRADRPEAHTRCDAMTPDRKTAAVAPTIYQWSMCASVGDAPQRAVYLPQRARACHHFRTVA